MVIKPLSPRRLTWPFLLRKRMTFCIMTTIFLLGSCSEKPERLIFSSMQSDWTGIDFVNQITMSDTFNILHYMYFFNGGGVGIGDINNDGLDDIYFSGNQTTSKLYVNQGNLTFKDVTEASGAGTDGWSSGVCMVDINADGWLDIYVCRTGSKLSKNRTNKLLINQGNLTFVDQAASYGLADTSFSTQAAFFDADKDGYLDMYLLNHQRQFNGANAPLPKKLHGEAENTDKLYKNTGRDSFIDISQQAGITVEGFGLGLAISDVNQDGWPDIYVANDFVSNDLLYINHRDGTFKNNIDSAIFHQSHNGMGCDIADINNDGYPDIFVADMLPASYTRRKKMAMNSNQDIFTLSQALDYQIQYTRNTLQLNNPLPLNGSDRLLFSEIGQLAGVDRTDWSWSGWMADLDNDGWKDLFITNGYLHDITDLDFIDYRKKRIRFTTKVERDSQYYHLIKQMPHVALENYLFKNLGQCQFADVTQPWAGFQKNLSNGAAVADLDNDGDLDLVINNINAEASLYKNTTTDQSDTSSNFIQIKLQGPPTNPLAIGSKVTLYHRGGLQYLENHVTRGYYSSAATSLHFGMGECEVIDSVRVIWPDDQVSVFKKISTNQEIRLDYGREIRKAFAASSTLPPYMTPLEVKGLAYHHRENDLPSFKSNSLLHRKHSHQGPGVAVGDIDGDGDDDFFFGGSSRHPGKLLIQHTNGFVEQSLPTDIWRDETDALLLDIDQDQDLDLYVVHGESNHPGDSTYFQDHIYVNQGSGQYVLDEGALPKMNTPGACVAASDIDLDGDLDLFVGGRLISGGYPHSPQSHILENQSGSFVDVTDQWNASIRNIGMVTDALWTDFDGDGYDDLMIVGEWMPICIFRNTGGFLEQIKPIIAGLPASGGWWNCLHAKDMDGDGDIDYLLGNHGLNSNLRATIDHPVRLRYGDFDGNGSPALLLTHHQIDDHGHWREVPYFRRRELMDHLPHLAKTLDSYEAFAQADITDIVGERVHQCLEVQVLESGYLQNGGSGHFLWSPLPLRAQVAPIQSFEVLDVNGDGHLDVLAVGNDHRLAHDLGRQDALPGLVLQGNGQGGFSFVPLRISGFVFTGDARKLATFTYQGKEAMVATRNNGSAKFWKVLDP